MDAGSNAGQIDYWNLIASRPWTRFQAQLDRQLDPLGREAQKHLALQSGEHVLDVGCGCGQTTLQLAAAVGPDGDVVGVDISEPMLAVAEARPRTGQIAPLHFWQTDAQEANLGEGAFDAIFSRFGVMFFADPPRAFANLRRALRPDGRLTFVCWRPFSENIWMSGPYAAAAPFFEAPPPADPKAPGPFAFAEPDYVAAILSAAGWSDIAIAPHDALIGGGDLETTLELALNVGGPLAAIVRERPELKAALAEPVRAWLAPYAGPDGVRLPAAVWIVSARSRG